MSFGDHMSEWGGGAGETRSDARTDARTDGYPDGFELFLQGQTRQHRMFASDHVWRAIQDSLHEKGRWPALTVLAILVITSLATMTVTMQSPARLKERQARAEKQQRINDQAIAQQNLAAPGTMTLQEALASGEVTARTLRAANAPSEMPVATTNASLAVADIKPEAVTGRNGIPITKQTTDLFAPQAASLNRPPVAGPDDLLPVSKDLQAASPLLDVNTSASSPALPSVSHAAPEKLATDDAADAAIQPMKESRFSYKLYVTPSVSYRRLINESGGKYQYSNNFVPLYFTGMDVNKHVVNRPSGGFELGVLFGYRIGNRLKIVAGAQFNERQYNIEVSSSTGYEPASVATTGPSGIDSTTQYSNYRNSGDRGTLITNRYQELSLPIGIDYKFVSRRRLQFGIAATVQPTYSFTNDPFIVSSDYSHYIAAGTLVRKWNLNTAIEGYLSYQTAGGVQWQIGPQFRYQQLSSYQNKYPIREFLLDYGLRIGVSKTIR